MAQFDSTVAEAHKAAVAAMANSYAPYSGLHVSAYLKLSGEQEGVVGVNVENASYGGTICAERSAILSAISQYGAQPFQFMVVISDAPSDEPIPPCGLCLQVIKEFVSQDFPIYLGSKTNLIRKLTLGELLPVGFQGDMLPQP